jgi:hypothetical protein
MSLDHGPDSGNHAHDDPDWHDAVEFWDLPSIPLLLARAMQSGDAETARRLRRIALAGDTDVCPPVLARIYDQFIEKHERPDSG